MHWYEILIIIFAALFVIGVVVWQIVLKVQGKSGCDCGSCSHCNGCTACSAGKKTPLQEGDNNRHTQSP